MVESEFSDRLWLSFSLALVKPNNIVIIHCRGSRQARCILRMLFVFQGGGTFR